MRPARATYFPGIQRSAHRRHAIRQPHVTVNVARGHIDLRQSGETFLSTYRRVGIAVFKERVYANAD